MCSRRLAPAWSGYLQKARISPDAAFSVLDLTAYVIFIVVIGGIGTLEGPIDGVMIPYLMQTYRASFGSWYLILLGVLAIATMLFARRESGGISRNVSASSFFRRSVASSYPRLPIGQIRK